MGKDFGRVVTDFENMFLQDHNQRYLSGSDLKDFFKMSNIAFLTGELVKLNLSIACKIAKKILVTKTLKFPTLYNI